MINISFNNRTYPLREIEFDFGTYFISTAELNNKLLNDNAEYVSEEARLVDEQIFYFVETNSLTISEDELITKILLEI